MAVTVTWSIADMIRDAASGGVKQVRWECVALADTGETAVEAGKYDCTPDATADNFILYEDLTESTVVSWVKDSLGADTVSEMEAQRVEKVEAQVVRKTANANGVPWQPAADPAADGNE